MEEMMKMYRMSAGGADGFSMPTEATLILNAGSSLIRRLGEDAESAAAEAAVRQIWKLALLSQRQLTAEELNAFLSDSFAMIEKSL